MTPYLLLIALLFLLAINVASAKAADPPKGVVVSNTIVQTWNCQDKLPTSRTRARSPWKHHTAAYWARELNLWTLRLNRCRATLARSIPNTDDWQTAVRLVQRVYPGTQDWLLKISHREGGWGRFVMNSQGSGCGGWMQFMSSTYWAYSGSAYHDLSSRGWRIDPRTNSWTNPLGQAVTAAYMRYTRQDGPHWTATDY